jgi:hypothetical protein
MAVDYHSKKFYNIGPWGLYYKIHDGSVMHGLRSKLAYLFVQATVLFQARRTTKFVIFPRIMDLFCLKFVIFP